MTNLLDHLLVALWRGVLARGLAVGVGGDGDGEELFDDGVDFPPQVAVEEELALDPGSDGLRAGEGGDGERNRAVIRRPEEVLARVE